MSLTKRSHAGLALLAVGLAATLAACSSTNAGQGDGGVLDGGPSGDAAPDSGDAAATVDSGKEAGDAGTDAAHGDGAPTDGAVTGDTGTPEAGAPYLCGSPAVTAPADGGAATLFASLGHQAAVNALFRDAKHVLGGDTAGGWILWDVASGQQIAGATAGAPVGLAGAVFADQTTTALEVRSTSDGSLLATIPAAGGTSAGLASDGSYVWTASAASLSVFSPSGTSMTSQTGSYAKASVYGSPGQVRVALGPAGADVIQTIPVAGGSPTVSPSFSGTFAAWFTDGGHFLSSVGNNVFVYTAAAVQAQLVPVGAVGTLGGGGSYFWNFQPSAVGNPVDVYAVGGNGQPARSYAPGAISTVVGSGSRLAIMPYGVDTFTVVDLDAPTYTDHTVTTPLVYLGAFAADPGGDWALGNRFGQIRYANASGGGGPLGCGGALGIGGSTAGTAGIGTPGGVLVFGQAGAQTVLPLPASHVAVTDDGSTVAASASGYGNQYATDRTLDVFKAPAWSVAQSFPSTLSMTAPFLLDFAMSRSGSTLARVIQDEPSGTTERRVTDITGATVVFSDTGSVTPILSPSGTAFALTDSPWTATSATRIYASGQLVNAIAGSAVGWIDDGHLLVDTYTNNKLGFPVYQGASVYDAKGALLTSPPLPEIRSFDPVSSTRIFSHDDRSFYDPTTGALIAATGLPTLSVVAGPYVVSVSGRSVLRTPF